MSGGGLAIAGLTVRYGAHVALREVSVRVAPGEVVALAGPNGSGKSSLLRAAIGLEPAVAGSVDLAGRSIAGLALPERARRVAWMPQEEPVGDDLTVEAFVRYGRYPHQAAFVAESPADRAAVAGALELAGADALRGRSVWTLSGGERQRARLARVLAQAAPVLLLDEPTAHLDIGLQLDVLDRIRALARTRRTAVAVALHDLNLAARYADRVVVLARGRVVADGTASEVLSPRLLFEVWGIASELRVDRGSGLPYLIPRTVAPTPGAEPSAEPRVGAPRVHVVAGGGSGAATIRRLVDAGFSVSVGALPLFDSDTAVAEELNLPRALEIPFAPVSEATRAQLRSLLASSAAVVVAPFPVGPANLANLEELVDFPRPRTVLCLVQPPGRPWDFTGGRGSELRTELLRRGGREIEDDDRLLDAVRGLVVGNAS